MNFFKIELEIEERLQADEKTKLLRLADGFHSCITDGPVHITIARKHRNLDFLWTFQLNKESNGTFFLLSPRLWKLLEELDTTGYFLRETNTKLVFQHESYERDYRQMVITGWGGIAKGIRRVESHRGKHCYTLPENPSDLLNLDQWDGSDIFRIWPACGIYVTERVAEIVKNKKIRGLHLRRIEEISFTPVDENVGLIGHPLASMYPEEKARKIGEPLGIYWWEEDKREA